MTKMIYYFRHGQTSHNARRIAYGDKQHASTLTPLGRAQAVRLGEELVRFGTFDLFLSSPLARAVQTATIVQGFNDMDFEGDNDLIEPINESQEVTWQRVVGLAKRLIALPQQKILLSTHGFVCDALSAHFQSKDVKGIGTLGLTPNCAIGWAEIGADGKVIETQHAYNRHLANLQTTPPEANRSEAYSIS